MNSTYSIVNLLVNRFFFPSFSFWCLSIYFDFLIFKDRNIDAFLTKNLAMCAHTKPNLLSSPQVLVN